MTIFVFIRILIATYWYLCSINQSTFICSLLEERCPIWMLWLPWTLLESLSWLCCSYSRDAIHPFRHNIMAMKWFIGRAASDDYLTMYQQHAIKRQNIMTGLRSGKRFKWMLFELLATGAPFTCRLYYVPRNMSTLCDLLYIAVVLYVQIDLPTFASVSIEESLLGNVKF